jgi:site-specific DNA recombinase
MDSSAEHFDLLAPYLRVSSEKQKIKGTIDTQRGDLSRYVAIQQVEPVGWYEDEAVSGYFVPFASRPDGARLRADVQAGRVRTVLVTKLDRFGRNAREILNAVHDLEALGARLVSLKENVDTSTPAGRFYLTVLAGIAELERDTIMERTGAGMDRRLGTTVYMGGSAPVGYAVEGKREHARLALADDAPDAAGYTEGDVVRLAWHLLLSEDWTCERIADHLTTQQIATRAQRRGKTTYRRNGQDVPLRGVWAPNTVYSLLTNPIYMGQPRYQEASGEIMTGDAPAYVTPEQYAEAQVKLREHRRYSTSAAHDYLLRGVLVCASCGAPFTTSWSRRANGTLWRYYACSTRHYRQHYFRRDQPDKYPTSCTTPGIGAERLEAEVWVDVDWYLHNPGETLQKLAEQIAGEGVSADEQRTELAKLQRALDAHQAERDSVVALFRKGRISEADLDRQLDQIAAESAVTEHKHAKQLATMRDSTSKAERLSGARTLLQQLRATVDEGELTPALKRSIVQKLVVEARVVTQDLGLSTRGKPKRRAQVEITYVFELRPRQLMQQRDDTASTRRPGYQLRLPH